jgi:hypothetical protein
MGIAFCKPEPVFKSVERILRQKNKTNKKIDDELRVVLENFLDQFYNKVLHKDYNTVQECVLTILTGIMVRLKQGEKMPIFGKIVWELSNKIPWHQQQGYTNRRRSMEVDETYKLVMRFDWKSASAATTVSAPATTTASAATTVSAPATTTPSAFNPSDVNENELDTILYLQFDETTPSA